MGLYERWLCFIQRNLNTFHQWNNQKQTRREQLKATLSKQKLTTTTTTQTTSTIWKYRTEFPRNTLVIPLLRRDPAPLKRFIERLVKYLHHQTQNSQQNMYRHLTFLLSIINLPSSYRKENTPLGANRCYEAGSHSKFPKLLPIRPILSSQISDSLTD